MPKLPRDVSGERVIRFLRHRGWMIEREGARHTVLAKGAVHVAVPRHARLKTGTLAAILREARVRADEAVDEL
ncbi:MAG: type II toxin-antitoxin system HicA family toxin [Thermoplasmatota archaeon]